MNTVISFIRFKYTDMSGQDFCHWLDEMGFTTQQAADLFGCSRRTAQYYRKARVLPYPVSYLCRRMMEEKEDK